MNKDFLKKKIAKSEFKTKEKLYNEFISHYTECVLEILEQNYLSDIKFWTGCIDGYYLRRKVLKNINLNKLKKILPEYIKIYKKGQYGCTRDTIDLVPLTNKVQKEIWERIKNDR